MTAFSPANLIGRAPARFTMPVSRRNPGRWLEPNFMHTSRPLWIGLLGCMLMLGCRPSASDKGANLQATVSFTPNPPQVGRVTVKIELVDAVGQAVRLEWLEVEGNMNHAGMRPVFTTLEETGPGQFEGRIDFTMGGDWFLILSGETADGEAIRLKVDVPGVKTR